MKGTLIKTDKGYILEGNNLPNPRRLSIKNCEAIELGYDLDELAHENVSDIHEANADFMFKDIYREYFKEGFQKALELMKHRLIEETEWEVEVVMDRIPADLAPGGWDVFPKLDTDGCLILKRVG